ncbi:cytochrome P450 [Catenulispora rubra]|uniref:cytochrome P450 n=1 Tax=Catenulispora rubra TaxID=280293 RepID=UPI001891F9E0|nr:cytochrome P450 [Catenulispora rubra]
MGEALHAVETMMLERRPGCPFDPPAELLEARGHGPVSSFTFPGDVPAYVITGYDEVRAVLVDPRFSARKELMLDLSMDITGWDPPPATPGEMVFMDEPLHGRYRKPLTSRLTPRRIRQLTERVEQITAECLDAMEAAGPPAELVSAFAKPIPTIMICELLGVPYEEREYFQEQVDQFLGGEASTEEQMTAFAAAHKYFAELVLAKRAHPTDDILSDLTETDLTNEDLKGISFFTMSAGFDTTANTLALSAFALLQNPEQLAVLRDEPEFAEGAVDELLRYTTVAKTFMRRAMEDVEVGGVLIKAGTVVVLSYNTANRDPERFPDPQKLDLRRKAVSHLAFGHGSHKCVGQQLARMELRIALTGLFNRFPTLRLAVPVEEIGLRPDTAAVYGMTSLPVTWDA